MNSKHTFAIVIVLVLAGAWFIFSQVGNRSAKTIVPEMPKAQGEAAAVVPSNEPATTEVMQSPVVVYTENGFSPKSLEVTVGTTVVFLNSSARNLWVASAPHPTHTGYPAFDEKGSVGNGKTFAFTFDKVGTWPYHNHLSPKDFGVVVVK